MEQIVDTHNMGEFQKNYVKWQKLDKISVQIVWFHLYKLSKMQTNL